MPTAFAAAPATSSPAAINIAVRKASPDAYLDWAATSIGAEAVGRLSGLTSARNDSEFESVPGIRDASDV